MMWGNVVAVVALAAILFDLVYYNIMPNCFL